MKRVWLVAQREFLAAVMNKGFVIGLLVMPVVVGLLIMLMPRLMRTQGSQIRGEVAVIDPTGQVFDGLRAGLTQEAISKRRTDVARRALENAPAPVREVAGESSNAAIEQTLGAAPALALVQRAATADVQSEKHWLTDTPAENASRHLALVVIHPDAITQSTNSQYGGYDIYIPDNTDERVETTIFDAMRDALVAARVRAHNMDRAQVEAVMSVRRARSVTVTAGAERQTNVGFNRFLPFIFAGLLVFGILIGGQTLLTQVLEEKSSRVIEVLLSALSPLELMAGKILGQMAVSMLVLALYVGMGLLMLTSFAMLGLIDPRLIVYLIVFFLVGYLVFASVFAAIGAAVNEMREAQSLMTPIMLLLMAPWFFAQSIGRDPASAFSVAMSLVPPVNTFAMMVRLASTTPPPLWQVALSLVIGVASAIVCMWFAAKIFKVGLLMHGKPPTLGTLIKWARMA